MNRELAVTGQVPRNPRSPGQVAFERFRDAVGGVRPWSELGSLEVDAWEQAGEGVIEDFVAGPRGAT